MDKNFSVKINVRDGGLEVSGEDKDWVDSKLKQLEKIYSNPLPRIPNTDEATTSAGTSASKKPVISRTSRTKSNYSTSKSMKNVELAEKITEEVKTQITAYLKERNISDISVKPQPAQAAILATFLQDHMQLDGVNQNDLYTVYTVMGYKSPGNIRSQLINAMNRNHYFSGVVNGKFKLSAKGENYGRYDSKAK